MPWAGPVHGAAHCMAQGEPMKERRCSRNGSQVLAGPHQAADHNDDTKHVAPSSCRCRPQAPQVRVWTLRWKLLIRKVRAPPARTWALDFKELPELRTGGNQGSQVKLQSNNPRSRSAQAAIAYRHATTASNPEHGAEQGEGCTDSSPSARTRCRTAKKKLPLRCASH